VARAIPTRQTDRIGRQRRHSRGLPRSLPSMTSRSCLGTAPYIHAGSRGVSDGPPRQWLSRRSDPPGRVPDAFQVPSIFVVWGISQPLFASGSVHALMTFRYRVMRIAGTHDSCFGGACIMMDDIAKSWNNRLCGPKASQGYPWDAPPIPSLLTRAQCLAVARISRSGARTSATERKIRWCAKPFPGRGASAFWKDMQHDYWLTTVSG
jgi:hypothetical protein